MSELTGGRSIVVYGQTEVVKDLIAARLEARPAVALRGRRLRPRARPERPRIRSHDGGARARVRRRRRLRRLPRRLPAASRGVLREFEREYPFGWLGILAEVAPSTDELVYARHERGFALLSLRSPELSPATTSRSPRRGRRAVARRADLGRSCSARIGARRAGRSRRGRSSRRASPGCAATCRADAARPPLPRRRRRAHRAADRREGPQPRDPRRARARRGARRTATRAATTRCSTRTQACLRRVWRAEHFSWWMTTMLHRLPATTRSTRSCSSRSCGTSRLARRGDLAGRELHRPRPGLERSRTAGADPGDRGRRRRLRSRDASARAVPTRRGIVRVDPGRLRQIRGGGVS